MFARTPRSRLAIAVVGAWLVAPAGAAKSPTMQRASAKKRPALRAMSLASAYTSNELSLERGTASRRGGRLLAPSLAPPVGEDHLEGAGDRNRGQGTEHSRELGTDQDRDQDDERRQLHRPPVDDRLQQVVLDLLVDDEEDHDDDPGGNRMEESLGADDDGGGPLARRGERNDA